MYCHKCGAPQPETANFCGKCGAQLEKTETPNAATPDPIPQPSPVQSKPSDGGVLEAFGKAPLWQKIFISVIFIAGGATWLMKGANKVTTTLSESKITSAAQQLVKESLRSPASFNPVSTTVTWKGRYQNRDAYVVKTEYDAQNGFGAMLRGCHYVAFALEGDQIHWNKLFFLEECRAPGIPESQLVEAVVIANFPDDKPKPGPQALTAKSATPTSDNPPRAVLKIDIKNEIDLKDGTYLAKEFGGQSRYALITHSHGRFEGADVAQAVCSDGFVVVKLPDKFNKVKNALKPTDYVLTKCDEGN